VTVSDIDFASLGDKMYLKQTDSGIGKEKVMDWRLLITVLGTVFLAELGDKTQLATFSFTLSSKYPFAVFLGGSLALILSTLLAVVVGAGLQKIVPIKILHSIAAIAFIVIGILLLIKTIRST